LNSQLDYNVGKTIPKVVIFMLEQLFIGFLFLSALAYMAARLWREFSPKKSGCGKGCGCDSSAITQS
jgi:hypothetical protein